MQKMSFVRNNGMNNEWQQPIEPNVPLDIEQQGEGPQNPSRISQPMAQMSTMDPNQFMAQISAVTTQPQFGVFQNPMVQNMPSLGQQLQPPQFQQMPGNFPGYFHNPTGIFAPAIQNPQPTPDWNTIVGVAVAAQTSHLHQEMEQMRSLMGVGQNMRSENSSSSRLLKRTQSDLSEESEDSCKNCAKWRHKYEKVHADTNSMFHDLQSARCKVDLLEREAKVLRHKLKRAQNISPPQPGNPRLEITCPPQVKGKSDSSRLSEAHPQVGTSASGGGRLTCSLPYGWVTIPPGPIAWQATEGQEPPTGQAILPPLGPIAWPSMIGKEPPIGQATLFGSLDTMMSSAELDEFGKDDNQIKQKFDPDFLIRRTSENSMVHDAAYAWWTSPSGKQFVDWLKATFRSSEVKALLHKAAMDIEKTV